MLTNLDVQEYWKLVQGGYSPVSMVMSTVMTGCIARRWPAGAESVTSLGRLKWMYYQYTEAGEMVVVAYRKINEEIRERGLAMGAEGVIGVRIDSRKWREDASRQTITRQAFKIIVTMVGTAISPTRDNRTERPAPPPLSPGARLLGNRASDGDGMPDARPAGLRITPVRHMDAP